MHGTNSIVDIDNVLSEKNEMDPQELTDDQKEPADDKINIKSLKQPAEDANKKTLQKKPAAKKLAKINGSNRVTLNKENNVNDEKITTDLNSNISDVDTKHSFNSDSGKQKK